MNSDLCSTPVPLTTELSFDEKRRGQDEWFQAMDVDFVFSGGCLFDLRASAVPCIPIDVATRSATLHLGIVGFGGALLSILDDMRRLVGVSQRSYHEVDMDGCNRDVPFVSFHARVIHARFVAIVFNVFQVWICVRFLGQAICI